MIGDLVQNHRRGQWMTQPPARCHTFGPGEVLVGHQACLGHGGGDTTWTCLVCDETVYGPPLGRSLQRPGRAGLCPNLYLERLTHTYCVRDVDL